MVRSLGLTERVHFLGYVSDDELHALYAKATLFIYPSLLEGFGLPLLESMASGCPVITSTTSSLPEIAGNAAILVNPRDVDEVASAIEAVCKDDHLASQMKQKGSERAVQFSWVKCAQQTTLIYESLV